MRRLLRRPDRMVVVRGATEIELYQAEPTAATGDVLVFTESHCLPERETAEAVLRSADIPRTRLALRPIHFTRSTRESLASRN